MLHGHERERGQNVCYPLILRYLLVLHTQREKFRKTETFRCNDKRDQVNYKHGVDTGECNILEGYEFNSK